MPATTISSLPTEIHLKIIKNLDRVSSVCLGLTNKKLYTIHKELHLKVPLIAAHLYPKGGIRLWIAEKADERGWPVLEPERAQIRHS